MVIDLHGMKAQTSYNSADFYELPLTMLLQLEVIFK